MREAHAKNPVLRSVTRGVKKTCSYCGGKDHTKRSCPVYRADMAQQVRPDIAQSCRVPEGVPAWEWCTALPLALAKQEHDGGVH